MNTKKISELEMLEATSESTNVVVEENGKAKRVPASAIGGKGGGTQPDWNQNDPEQPDYIKNRPCYEEMGFADIIPEQQVTFADGSASFENFVDPCYGLGAMQDSMSSRLRVYLEINGETVECDATYYYAFNADFGTYEVSDSNIQLRDGATVQNGDTVTVRM